MRSKVDEVNKITGIKTFFDLIYYQIRDEQEISGEDKTVLNDKIGRLLFYLEDDFISKIHQKEAGSQGYRNLIEALKKIQHDTQAGNH